MSVYVDPLMQHGAVGKYKGAHAAQADRVGARNNHMWCHMFAAEADREELHKFAASIGMKREWFHRDHYDLTPHVRYKAVQAGAIPLTTTESVAFWRKLRAARSTP